MASTSTAPSTSSSRRRYPILEVNLVSAQNLEHVKKKKKMKTYAKVWINPDHKHKTRVHHGEGTDPTWNERFKFAVDNDFLRNSNSAVFVDVYFARFALPDKKLARFACPLGDVMGEADDEEEAIADAVILHDNLFEAKESRPKEEPGVVRNHSTGTGEMVSVGMKALKESITFIGSSSMMGWPIRELSMEDDGRKKRSKFGCLMCFAS